MHLNQFIERAQEVPFLKKGRSYKGWDCWGLIYLGYRDVYRIQLPRYTDGYNSTRRQRELHDLINRKKTDEVWHKVETYRPGDVALMVLNGQACHVGLMVDQRRTLHVEEQMLAIVEPLEKTAIKNGLEGVYRHVNLL